jgi:hypothetical protein
MDVVEVPQLSRASVCYFYERGPRREKHLLGRVEGVLLLTFSMIIPFSIQSIKWTIY